MLGENYPTVVVDPRHRLTGICQRKQAVAVRVGAGGQPAGCDQQATTDLIEIEWGQHPEFDQGGVEFTVGLCCCLHEALQGTWSGGAKHTSVSASSPAA